MMCDLFHYYDLSVGPFRNISHLSDDEAQAVLERIRRENRGFAAGRRPEYLARRRELEAVARSELVRKSGSPLRSVPHYYVVGACPWLSSWFPEPAYVQVPITAFDTRALSFTYGDLFPTFSPNVTDGRPYRRTVYTFGEIQRVIEQYGLPQVWNADGSFGPERYVEVQAWCDPPCV